MLGFEEMPTVQIDVTRVRKKLHTWYHPDKCKQVNANAIFKTITDISDKLSASIRSADIHYLSPPEDTSSDNGCDDESNIDDSDEST